MTSALTFMGPDRVDDLPAGRAEDWGLTVALILRSPSARTAVGHAFPGLNRRGGPCRGRCRKAFSLPPAGARRPPR